MRGFLQQCFNAGCVACLAQTLADAKSLAGQSGLVSFLVTEEAKYGIVKQCSALSSGGNS